MIESSTFSAIGGWVREPAGSDAARGGASHREDPLWSGMVKRHGTIRSELARRQSVSADIAEGLKMDIETLVYLWMRVRRA